MTGLLYGVGVGCGDPYDMTLKAIRAIEKCEYIAIPVSAKGRDLVAFDIAKVVCNMENKKFLHLEMPMTRDEEKLTFYHKKAANEIIDLLNLGEDIAFLTLGDPTVYSTYMYVDEIIKKNGYKTEIISGITSFTAVAAKKGISLCSKGEALVIIPASYEGLSEALDIKGTKVLMKTGKQMPKVKEILKEKDLYDNSFMIERCNMSGEKIHENLDTADENSGYFSIIVAKENI